MVRSSYYAPAYGQRRRRPTYARKVRYTRNYKKAVRRRTKKQLSTFQIAQLNPFSKKSYNVRVPDASTAPSSSFFTVDSVTFTVSTTNALAYAFEPNCKIYSCCSNSNTSTSWYWPLAFGNANAVAQFSSVASQYTCVRPVAHAVRLTCPLSLQTCTGYAHIALYTSSVNGITTWPFPSSVSAMLNCSFYKRIPLSSLINKPIVYGNKFIGQEAFTYIDPNDSRWVSNVGPATNGLTVPNGWMTIVIAVEGAPSGSSCLEVENLIHFEGQSKPTALGQDGPAEPCDNINMQSTANVMSQTDPVVEVGVNSVNTDQAYEDDMLNKIMDEVEARFGQQLNNAADAVTGVTGTGKAIRAAAGYVKSTYNKYRTDQGRVTMRQKRAVRMKKLDAEIRNAEMEAELELKLLKRGYQSVDPPPIPATRRRRPVAVKAGKSLGVNVTASAIEKGI